MIALLLALLCGTANALEVRAPSPNSGTITPTEINAVTGSFSGSVTVGSMTANGSVAINNTTNSGAGLNRSVIIYEDSGSRYGMTLGHNGTLYRNLIYGSDNQQIAFGFHATGVKPTINTDITDRLVIDGATGNVGIGTASPEAANKLQAQAATGNVVVASSTTASGFGVFSAHGTSGGCIMLTDTDNAGWTKCKALNGTLSCATDSDGICD